MDARIRRFVPELVVVVLFLGYLAGLKVGRFGGTVDGLATVGSVAIVPAVRRSGVDAATELRLLVAAGLTIGVVSVVTGLGNNATDEPFTMGAYLSTLLHGRDPYTSVTTLTFTPSVLWGRYSHTVTGQFQYVYLPVLLFFQVPGTGATGYKAMDLACWAGIVYLVRRDKVAGLSLASPFVALLAANGFTDLPVLLLMTFSLRGATGRSEKAAELVTYGMKQFANVFWVLRYALRRDPVRLALVLAITLAWCAPFLLWHPTGVWCGALTLGVGPGCTKSSGGAGTLEGLYLHWNYYLWVLWVYALYPREVQRGLRRAGAWLAQAYRSAAPAAPPGR